MMIDINTVAQAVSESTLETPKRQKRAIVNDMLDKHPVLRADMVKLFANGDAFKHPYDLQRAVENTILEYDERNGQDLSGLDVTPYEIVKFGTDRLNRHLANANTGLKISRNRIVELQLEHKPAADEPAAPETDNSYNG